MSLYTDWMEKLEQNDFTVGILGLGYVGLPLAVTFALKNVKVLGFEKSTGKVRDINAGKNYIADVADDDLKKVVSNKHLSATDDFSRLSECDAVLICVPTPLDRFKKPDMSYIESACRSIGNSMRRGMFIALESTTYPTTTENFMLPILEEVSGMKCCEDFFLAYSPERVDPGNKSYKTDNTPKVVGSIGEDAREIALKLYGKAIKQLYPVSSPKAAEMVKILENTYRLVNISLINELALLSGKMGINIWEVIDAAKTKPYGFQAFYPGPGIGGHCIPLDPFYLEYIAKNFNFDLSMIHTAGQINTLMPHRMMNKIMFALNRMGKSVNGSKILFLGIAYKPDIGDSRESPALMVMDEIQRKRGIVLFHDPYIKEAESESGNRYTGKDLSDELVQEVDCVVFSTNHSVFDVNHIVEKASLVVDLRNAVKNVNIENEKVFKL
ncbi:nucleotide sugar dehydrogenase [Marispirochaeta sp.]|uniref:nucleotide sugar dehydrogenase n=1 Tax=Marispirochaeta sp. TaxID=2038653 RepID=UPI0029C6D0F6|nr:nucleotide sugar dehydrogenase [Marispirochaeta sp.]